MGNTAEGSTSMARTDIVVGTDGTMAGAAAVRWAAAEAARRNVLLRIVHCFDWDHDSYRHGCSSDSARAAQAMADAVTTAALHQARAVAPGIWLEADAMIGDPASHLIELSDAVALVVVGSRERGDLAALILGSVSRRVAVHASCPVTVVRGRRDVREAPIAVGVDLSPRGEMVLQRAYELAELRGCDLRVVHSYTPVISPWVGTMSTTAVPARLLDEAEEDRLHALLAPWQDKYPQVGTTVCLTRRPPASALTLASKRAGLLVVGSHGHGAVSGTLLGSTSLHLLHHADCPVTVVHTRVAQLQEGSRR
ncbi:universal stress protein [Actinoplanes sp. NPDC049548]|uniref:universal stress protein n=1 Tax=Actinoplanes sp. NPDC049548 TaxID=3155152 RepID=UPI0034232B61